MRRKAVRWLRSTSSCHKEIDGMGALEIDTNKLAKVLASASDVLFPATLGKKQVRVNSAGVCGDTPLHVMAWRKDTEAVRILIDAGANVNAVGEMGETALHIAVRNGSAGVVELLLKANALTSIRSEFGQTSAEFAAEKGGDIAAVFKRCKRLSKNLLL